MLGKAYKRFFCHASHHLYYTFYWSFILYILLVVDWVEILRVFESVLVIIF